MKSEIEPQPSDIRLLDLIIHQDGAIALLFDVKRVNKLVILHPSQINGGHIGQIVEIDDELKSAGWRKYHGRLTLIQD